MEPLATWAPCEFQQANWSVEEPAADVWAPSGLPVEYASIDIFGTCSLQAYVHESSGGQQLVDHYCSAVSQHTAFNTVSQTTGIEQVVETDKISDNSSTNDLIIKVVNDLKEHIDLMEKKMHKYPARLLAAVDKSYTKPRIVAIGPYHHREYHLRRVEVKVAAARHCIKEGHTMDHLFQLVGSAADETRHLYDKDVIESFDCHYFQAMMFIDACFLVQYMLMQGGRTIHESLHGFLSPNRDDIFHDIMLLENQLPWNVVETVMSYMDESMMHYVFVDNMRYCMLPKYFDQKQLKEMHSDCNGSYMPPHLLGLLRYYIVGRSDRTDEQSTRETRNTLFSMSAIKLEKIGIELTANKTYEINDMRLSQEGTDFFPKLSLAPLSLDCNTASDLINMAAFELCTVKSFSKAREEDSAVCSYLTLLSMLVNREEDVQQLRKRDLLQGGGGLSDNEALRFFTSVQGMRLGPCYNCIMREIQYYREKKWGRVWWSEFHYNYGKFICTVVFPAVGIIATLVGVIVSIFSITPHVHT